VNLLLGFLYKIRSDHVKTALGAEKGGGYPEISKLRRSPATIYYRYIYYEWHRQISTETTLKGKNVHKGQNNRECENDE